LWEELNLEQNPFYNHFDKKCWGEKEDARKLHLISCSKYKCEEWSNEIFMGILKKD